jgi:hypothetical protein
MRCSSVRRRGEHDLKAFRSVGSSTASPSQIEIAGPSRQRTFPHTGAADGKRTIRCVLHVRLSLHHRDGRREESSLDGDGPFGPEGVIHLPPHADHWWKVRSLRWDRDARIGFAELEPLDDAAEALDARYTFW